MELNDTLDGLERNTDFLYDYDFDLEKETALKEDGRKEGLKEGLNEGRLEERKKFIKRMLEKDIELSMIAECANLKIEEVEKIIESFK